MPCSLAALLLYVRAVVNGSSPMFEILGWITFALAVFGALAVAWGLLAFHSEECVLTTRRLIHADGVINKRASDVSLDRITDAVLTEPFLGRLLGYGDLADPDGRRRPTSACGSCASRRRSGRRCSRRRHELELERARPTMPPIRIVPPGGAAAPPVAPPPPPSAPAMTQGEVVAELSRLAARRAAGEIDAETFDRGRRDLLSRL